MSTNHYTINCSSRSSNGMELNGNILSGDTFGMKSYIKEYWGGKWSASDKTWTVDAQLVIDTINAQSWGFTKVLSIGARAEIKSAATNITGVSGWCNHCHSYCYGDCQSR